jgi:hypothetical protein
VYCGYEDNLDRSPVPCQLAPHACPGLVLSQQTLAVHEACARQAIMIAKYAVRVSGAIGLLDRLPGDRARMSTSIAARLSLGATVSR